MNTKVAIASSFPLDKKLAYEDLMKVTKEIIKLDNIQLSKGTYIVFQQISSCPDFFSAIEYVPSDFSKNKVIFILKLSKGVAYVGDKGLPLILQKEDFKTIKTAIDVVLFDYDYNKSIKELLGKNIKSWVFAPASLEVELEDGTKYLNMKGVSKWES